MFFTAVVEALDSGALGVGKEKPMMDTKKLCSCERRLSFRQTLVIAWAPVVAVFIDGVLRLVR